MEERKRRFNETEVTDGIREALQRVMGPSMFDGVHYFTPSVDVPDDWSLRLAVLPPNQAWSRTGPNPARDAAATMLKMRGDQPRQKQNRLLFLAADSDQVMHLKDMVRALLAWRSIEADAKDLRLNLDVLNQRQATQNREQTADAVHRLVREAYKWLVAPSQAPKRDGGLGDIEWEPFGLNAAALGLGKELDRVLSENELVIREWAPVHLHNLLKTWFWKDGATDVPALDVWQKTCSYLYFPRLAKSTVMQTTIAAGASSLDFFGLASGKDGERYMGFTLGQATSPFMDVALLIEPAAAAAYEEAMRPPPVELPPDPPIGPKDPPPQPPLPPLPPGAVTPTHFWASAELDPVGASLKFANIMKELVELFSARHGTNVVIKVDIDATDSRGFDETTVRAAKENSRVLGIQTSEFD
jgi:hypothetical protein